MMENPKTNITFLSSCAIVILITALGATLPAKLSGLSGDTLMIVSNHFGWLYLISVFTFVCFLFYLALSRYGKIKLGSEDSGPAYGTCTWLSMLLAAGFGVGLVFYGMAEPMFHYVNPPFDDAEGKTTQAARLAIQYSFFNWGVHQWSASALVGLIIAYFQYNRGRKGLISSVFTDLETKSTIKTNRFTMLDIIAIVVTVIGVATSLGLGVLQINSGIADIINTPDNASRHLIILAAIFIAYMLSTYTGLDKGIKYLSLACMTICLAVMAYILITGPTTFILNSIALGIGDYAQNFIGMSLRTSPNTSNAWASSWTIFYWAWIIAWSPFVGTFIARISKGRTIREFVFGVLLVPPLIACLWIGVLGSSALYIDSNSNGELSELVQSNITSAIFQMFETMPNSLILSSITMLLIFFFLVTSLDSATYIVAQMSDDGSQSPSVYKRTVWGVLISVSCWVLLTRGGLTGLQSASIVAALPLTIIIFFMAFSFMRKLHKDPIVSEDDRKLRKI